MAESWMPRHQWEALKAGNDCPMCLSVAEPAMTKPQHRDDHGYTIAALDSSILRLSHNQAIHGYCVLIAHQHGPELHDLPLCDLTAFHTDLQRASRALTIATGADKMNTLILGNAIPHLHAHLVPRYYNDPAPAAPLFPDNTSPTTITEVRSLSLINDITAALTTQPEP